MKTSLRLCASAVNSGSVFIPFVTFCKIPIPQSAIRNPQSAIRNAFTLIELLTVIAIIGIMMALVAPVVGNFRKGDAIAAASNSLVGNLARCRQLAIAQHTTVYMVFCPTNFWQNLTPNDFHSTAATNLVDKQLTGFIFMSPRSIGDQPGRPNPQYLSKWESLPEGTFFPTWLFGSAVTKITDLSTGDVYPVTPLNWSTNLPFPVVTASRTNNVAVPYVAFDSTGQPVWTPNLGASHEQPVGFDTYIPLAQGSVVTTAAGKPGQFITPSVQETPPGNSTNTFHLARLDALTGRATAVHQQVK